MKPVAYLDVDGTLLRYPNDKRYYETHPNGGPPDGVVPFFEWLTTHFEVRWLTAWVSQGHMHPNSCDSLAKRIGVSADILASICNPLAWEHNKTEAIDWREFRAGREFVWIDDELSREDENVLRKNGAFDRWYPARCSMWADDLTHIRRLLARRFAVDA